MNPGTGSMAPKTRAAIAIVAAALFVAVVARFHSARTGPTASSELPIFVEAVGDVRNPGIYALDRRHSSIAGLLDAAGGLRDGGKLKAVSGLNDPGPLRSGQAVRFVRTPSGAFDVRLEDMQSAARLTIGGKLDLNRASVEELCLVPQMKPEIAAAIVSRRAERPWGSLPELSEIHGIGPKTIEKWQDYLEAAPAPPVDPQ